MKTLDEQIKQVKIEFLGLLAAMLEPPLALLAKVIRRWNRRNRSN